MDNDILKSKRALLMTSLINQIKSSIEKNKIKAESINKIDIYNRLSDYTYYSEVSIRKFLTGSVPKDLSSFIDGIIKYSKLVKVEDEYIENFVREYTEACNSIILKSVKDFETKTNMPFQDFSSIIRTEKLTNFLDEFLEDKMNMSYIYGYKLSGKTKSVMAYIYDLISKNLYENILFIDIKEENQCEKIFDTISMFAKIEVNNLNYELKERLCLNYLKSTNSLICIDMSESKLQNDTLNLLKEISKNTKIIIISSVPFEKYEEELTFYCKKFSIIGFMNKSEFKKMLENNATLLPILTTNEEFVDKVYKLTGGLPFASLHIFKRIIEANKYGESLENIIENYSNFKEDEYEVLASKLISDKWNELSELAKKILIVCAKFDYSISIRLVSNICGVLMASEQWKSALNECYESDLVSHMISNTPRLIMNNMIKTLVRSKSRSENLLDEEKFLQRIYDRYLDISEYVDECYNEINRLKVLDEPDEFNIVNQVLEYLYDARRYKEYIVIIRNLKYYIYVRGKWEIGENSIHLKRAEAARKISDFEEELEAYCDYINIMSKSRNTEEAEKYLKIATKIQEENFEEINRRILCLYNHVKALYLYNCLEEYKEAYELWYFNEQNYFEDISEYRKLVNNLWSNRCYLKLEKDFNKVASLFELKAKEMEEKDFIRAAIDYRLLLIAVLLKQFEENLENKFLDEAEQNLEIVRDMLANKSTFDIRNEATYYKLRSLTYAYKKDKENENKFFEKACAMYKMMNCYKDIENLKYDLDRITKKTDE